MFLERRLTYLTLEICLEKSLMYVLKPDKPDIGRFDAAGFIETLASRGVILTAGADGKIRFEAPTGAFLPDLKRTAADNRDEIIRFLTDGDGGAVAGGSGDPADAKTLSAKSQISSSGVSN